MLWPQLFTAFFCAGLSCALACLPCRRCGRISCRVVACWSLEMRWVCVYCSAVSQSEELFRIFDVSDTDGHFSSEFKSAMQMSGRSRRVCCVTSAVWLACIGMRWDILLVSLMQRGLSVNFKWLCVRHTSSCIEHVCADVPSESVCCHPICRRGNEHHRVLEGVERNTPDHCPAIGAVEVHITACNV